MLRSGENVDLIAPTNFAETRTAKHPVPLCFQQSTRNSVGPKIYVILSALRDFFVDNDVCDLEPAGRP